MSREMEDRLRAALSAKAERVGEADLRPARLPAEPVRPRRHFRSSLPWLAPVFVAAAIVLVVVGVTAGWPSSHRASHNNSAASSLASPTARSSAQAGTPTPEPSAFVFGSDPASDAASAPAGGFNLPEGSALKALPSAVLGSTAYWPAGNTRGFGKPHPTELDTNGDPSGIVLGITWHNWGTATATGIGKTYLPKPGGGYYPGTAAIELQATRLGRCGSVAGYQQLLYRVPTQPGGQPTGAWQLWANATNLCQSR